MFGYVRVYKPEMKIKDYETYKSVYCGLCRRLGKEYGVFSRLVLNYDFTLLALFRIALNKECPGYQKGRCPFNPVKKCNYCKAESELSFAAAAAMIMLYQKLCDNIADSGFFKGLAMRIIKPYFSVKRRRAAKRFPQIDIIISEAMSEQSEVEKSKTAVIDAAAQPSAAAMSKLAVLGFENRADAAHIERAGYFIGRWVYLADAADDVEKDKKSGNFNPLIAAKVDKEKIMSLLNGTAGALCEEIKAIEFFRYRDIIDNIAFDGTYATMNNVLKGAKDE